MLILPAFYGAILFHALEKARTHNYIKRYRGKPDPKTGKPRWVYVYHVAHQGGVHAEDHMVEGSAFKLGEGHYHITGREGNKLTVRDDETGKVHEMTTDELAERLKEHHKEALGKHKADAVRDLEIAKKNGVKGRALAHLEKRVAVHGFHPILTPEPSREHVLSQELKKLTAKHGRATKGFKPSEMTPEAAEKKMAAIRKITEEMNAKAAELEAERDKGGNSSEEPREEPKTRAKKKERVEVKETKVENENNGEDALRNKVYSLAGNLKKDGLMRFIIETQKYLSRIRHAFKSAEGERKDALKDADSALTEVHKWATQKPSSDNQGIGDKQKRELNRFIENYNKAFDGNDDEITSHPDAKENKDKNKDFRKNMPVGLKTEMINAHLGIKDILKHDSHLLNDEELMQAKVVSDLGIIHNNDDVKRLKETYRKLKNKIERPTKRSSYT